MEKRERDLQLKIRVTEDEKKLIREKMAQIGTTNFNAFALKMLIDGYVIKRDFSELKQLTIELGAIGRNINQIAKRANETRSICLEDIQELQKDYFKVKSKISEQLVKLIREEI